MNYSKMKYIKLYEEMNPIDRKIEDYEHETRAVFYDDIKYICNLFDMTYELDEQLPNMWYMDLKYKEQKLTFVLEKKEGFAPLKKTVFLYSAYEQLSRYHIYDYYNLVKCILMKMKISNEQWTNVLERNPEFFNFLFNNKLDLYIPDEIKAKYAYLKNELF